MLATDIMQRYEQSVADAAVRKLLPSPFHSLLAMRPQDVSLVIATRNLTGPDNYRKHHCALPSKIYTL